MPRMFPIGLLTLASAAPTAVVLAIAPTPAQAAAGVLLINGAPHPDPSGCIETPVQGFVANHTNEVAFIHEGGGCQGKSINAVQPGGYTGLPSDSSISIE